MKRGKATIPSLNPAHLAACASYLPSETRILALDLARHQTGFAVMVAPTVWSAADTLRCAAVGTFHTDPRNDKALWYVAAELAEAVSAEIATHRSASLHVVIEHPVYGLSRSEQQYVLWQAVLGACAKAAVNVTSVTNTFQKVFIREQLEDAAADVLIAATQKKPRRKRRSTKYRPLPDKAAIAAFYERVTYPQNPWLPDPSHLANDDEFDALYLALIGALWTTDIPDWGVGDLWDAWCSHQPPNPKEPPWIAHSLWTSLTPFGRPLLRSYANLTWRPHGLSHCHTAFRKNSHRTQEGHLDYSFNQAALCEALYRFYASQAAPEAAAWRRRVEGRRTQRDLINPPHFLWTTKGTACPVVPLRRTIALPQAEAF